MYKDLKIFRYLQKDANRRASNIAKYIIDCRYKRDRAKEASQSKF